MEFKLKLWRSVLIVIILILTIHYLRFVYTTPLNYDWPNDVKFKDYQSLVDDYNESCIRGFCYKLPFDVTTQQILEINIDRKEGNTFIINSKTFVETNENIELRFIHLLNESRVLGIPEISLNEEKKNMNISNGFYELEPIVFTSDKHPNIFDIKGLILKRDIYNLNEIKRPWFFKKDRYVESINIPEIFPFFIKKGEKTKEIIYTIEVPQFYKIDKLTSGFQKVSFPYNSINIGSDSSKMIINIGELTPIRTGTINQLVDDTSNKDKITFTTFISLENPFYSFEVSFTPSLVFLLLIIFLLLVPLIVDTIGLLKKEIKDKRNFIISCYSLILAGLGSIYLFNLSETYQFFHKLFYFVNPIYLILLFFTPPIYVIISNMKVRKEYILNIYKIRVIIHL